MGRKGMVEITDSVGMKVIKQREITEEVRYWMKLNVPLPKQGMDSFAE